MDQRCAWVPIGQLRPFCNNELADSEIGWRGRLECEFVGVRSSWQDIYLAAGGPDYCHGMILQVRLLLSCHLQRMLSCDITRQVFCLRMTQPAWRFKPYSLRGCNLSLLRHDMRCWPEYRFQGYWIWTSRSVSIIWHCGMDSRSRRCLLIQPSCSLEKQVIIQTGSTHCKGLGLPGGGRWPERVGLLADAGFNWCAINPGKMSRKVLTHDGLEIGPSCEVQCQQTEPCLSNSRSLLRAFSTQTMDKYE
jgi:hypothetical protein